MITSNVPNDQSTQPLSQIQQLNPEQAPAFLEHGDLSHHIKGLLLRYLIEQSIQSNTAEQIVSGVEVIDLDKNKTLVSYNANTQHFAASINKLPVTLLILDKLQKGELQLDQTVSWSISDRRAGAGIYDQVDAVTSATVGEVVFDLLNRSGNTAVRVLVNQLLGGAAAVNERWSQIPQLAHTRLETLDANRFYIGDSTPKEALWTMQQLINGSDPHSQFIRVALSTNIYTDVGVRSRLAGNDYVTLANKIGLLNDAEGNNRHDVGIIYNAKTKKSYGYAFFTTSPYDRPAATPRAEASIEEMGKYTLRYAGDKQKPLEHTILRQEQQIDQRILY